MLRVGLRVARTAVGYGSEPLSTGWPPPEAQWGGRASVRCPNQLSVEAEVGQCVGSRRQLGPVHLAGPLASLLSSA